jgi:hypothetical protein
MSVNIFGSSRSAQSSGSNREYIDQKFSTLSTNLATKVNKSGDSLSGNLNILFEKDDSRIFGVKDINTGKSVSLLLGDIDNQIRHNFGHSINISANHGTKFECPAGDVCRFGEESSKSAVFFDVIDMNDNNIKNLRNPSAAQDAANKQYVDDLLLIINNRINDLQHLSGSNIGNKFIKNNVGLIPDLISNKQNKSGFIVSATGAQEKSYPWHVFNSRSGDLQFVNFPVMAERWVKIKCPEQIQIYKFTVRGLDGENTGTISTWKFQGSNNNRDWDDLYEANMENINYEFKTYQLSSTSKYFYFRLIILTFTGDKIDLNHLQIYTLDPVL